MIRLERDLCGCHSKPGWHRFVLADCTLRLRDDVQAHVIVSEALSAMLRPVGDLLAAGEDAREARRSG